MENLIKISQSNKYSNLKNNTRLIDTYQKGSVRGESRNFENGANKKAKSNQISPSNIVFLQVNGISQLEKEVQEISRMPSTAIDYKALNRNEQTGELEPEGQVDEFLVTD